MTDIVERLRDNVKWLERDGFLTNARNTEEAADEIERLRADLDAAQAREAKLRSALTLTEDSISHFSYMWHGDGCHPNWQ